MVIAPSLQAVRQQPHATQKELSTHAIFFISKPRCIYCYSYDKVYGKKGL
jgi:hypothetical protein